ncbi:Iron-containing alcohol dehydrogenase [compost metagenome]
MSKVEKALAAAGETRALRIGWGILTEVADLFTEQFPAKAAVVIADPATYRVAGKRVHTLLEEAGIPLQEPFIFQESHLYAEYGFVDKLVSFLRTHEAIPVVVGSGTLNDLTKLAAHLTQRQYLCVATAASMDGYTAFGASITANGAKQTFNCPAPQACLADIEIISRAPTELTAAGFADLFAKVTAGADWILADRLEVEAIDPTAWAIVQDGLHEALADPDGVGRGDTIALSKLVEGLMLSGFAMQWMRSSRPASGAEHQFSHLWNMENHLNHGEHVSHGFQVSIGTLAITALYEVFFDTPVNQLNINQCTENWPSATALAEDALHRFSDTDFPDIGFQETQAKYIDSGALFSQLKQLKEDWVAIKSVLQQQIIPLSEVKRRLALVGAPVEPEQIGISRVRLRETFIRAQYIRRRFTLLDVAVRTGYLPIWLDRLFGSGGIWEIQPPAYFSSK